MNRRTVFGLSQLTKRVLAVVGALLIVLVAVWLIDSRAAGGGSPRRTSVGGVDVSRQSEAEVAEAVADLGTELGRTPVLLTVGEREIRTTAAELALEVDQRATVAAVVGEVDRGPLIFRPIRWLGTLFTARRVPVAYTVRTDELALALDALGVASEPAQPPTLDLTDGIEVVPGQPGLGPDPEEVADELRAAARRGDRPIEIEVDEVELEPRIDDEAAERAAAMATDLAGDPFTVVALEHELTFTPAELRAWLTVKPVGDELEVGIDDVVVEEALKARVADLGLAEPKDAAFTIEGGAIALTPAVVALACCPPGTVSQIVDARVAGAADVTIDALAVEPELTTAEAEALGIVEPVGTTTEWAGRPQVRSFTTYFTCCEARVTNIQRIADLVRGTVVLPGESLSLNELVGERTAEKGFVEAGAILNGEIVQELGGGVSQFATTMFNAAFFAGLPIPMSRPHSQYFSRYPYGREATMGWTDPDLVIENDTPYGILVWTEHTDTSVTVTLYSTQYASGQQTGQTEGRAGRCTVVTTQRTITRPDAPSVVDEFEARYRDEGATRC